MTSQRALGLGLALLLGAAGAGAQGTSGVALTRQHGNNLYIEINGQKLGAHLTMGIAPELTLTVSPQDSLGNSIPLSGFEVQVWDSNVVAIAGSTVMANRAEVRITPKHPGQTTLQVRGSGIRSWVAMELGKENMTFQPGAMPGEGGPSNNILIAGGRLGYEGYSYSFNNQAAFSGKGGVVGEAFIGRDYNFGLVLVLGLGLGVLKADSLAGSVTPMEWEMYLRGDWVFLRDKQWRPVVSLGTGGYRIRTGHNGGIWNTSIFWTAGGGVDYTLGPRAIGEARVSTQQLYEANSQLKNGYVGNLLLFSVGARFALK